MKEFKIKSILTDIRGRIRTESDNYVKDKDFIELSKKFIANDYKVSYYFKDELYQDFEQSEIYFYKKADSIFKSTFDLNVEMFVEEIN